MRTRPRKSLRARLTLVCTMLTLAALTFTGIDSWRREQATLRQNTLAQLTTIARLIASNAAISIEFDNAPELGKLLASVTAAMNAQAIAVYLADGRRFAVSGRHELLPMHGAEAMPAHADPVVRIGLPYVDGGVARTGSVVVRTSGDADRARLRTYVVGLIATAVVALVGLGLAARWLLARLLRPVAALVETTHRVRETEDYSLRSLPGADDEIGELVRAFNDMLGAIQERDRNLAGNAQRLEQLVRERTAELRGALDAAESATRAKSTFVANISHEIRTPLNAILGMTELALETEDPREQREYLGVIRSAGTNLLGILCDVLDLSKIESDKLELSPVPTELEAMVLDALRPLTARIQSKELDLSFDLEPELAPAYLVDDVRLRQVLTNLVGNSIKFTPKGFVRVALQRVGGDGDLHEVELTVQDSGVGIPPDRLHAIFTPFTQADSTITRRFAGTGLGLSITDRLVRLMGGRITVESTVGEGSTFRVVLPLRVGASPLPPMPELPAATRVFLVSRSPSLRRTLATIGARLRITVVAVDSAGELRGRTAANGHDFVLLDDRDPDHDAIARDTVPVGARGVRALFVATSFQDLANASARCQHNQFAGYVTKPVSARELAVRIANQLRNPFDAAPSSIAARPPAAAAPKLRILVAEDNAVNQKLIERILERDGHEVTLAENGRACCDAWAPERFDLVLMDMQMPEMSGLEAAAWIRRAESSTGSRVPIIALTANTTPEDRRACLHAGMDDMLPKPVSVPRLRATLANVAATNPPPPTTGPERT